MQRTAVTPVILGLLWHRPMSGYDVKAAVDRSTNFFWAASYGQLYPELRRLEEAGLVTTDEAPVGARARHVHRITDAGRAELEDWLRDEQTTVAYRDENLLRLFFADALPREEALRVLEDRRGGHEAWLAMLREIARDAEGDPPFASLALRWGLAFHEWGARWCTSELRRLREAEG